MKITLFLFLFPFICFCQSKKDSVSKKPTSQRIETLTKIVINAPAKTKEVGYHNLRKTFLPTRSYQLSMENYIGIYIENPDMHKLSFIKALLLEIENKEKAKIQIQLYTFDPTTKTLKDILFDEVISVPRRTNTLKIPIEKKEITFPPEGVFFAVKLVESEGAMPMIPAGKLNLSQEASIYSYDPIRNTLFLLPNTFPKTGKKFALMLGLSIHQY